tara:strand:+ start:87 stop:332 length:246 start_codon:yes stop_codon:yes gene_type:complete
MNRTKEERQNEAKIIISKLTELNLTTIYEPVQELLKMLKIYIENGETIKINIPFYSIKKIIVGKLYSNKSENCWLKLTNID